MRGDHARSAAIPARRVVRHGLDGSRRRASTASRSTAIGYSLPIRMLGERHDVRKHADEARCAPARVGDQRRPRAPSAEAAVASSSKYAVGERDCLRYALVGRSASASMMSKSGGRHASGPARPSADIVLRCVGSFSKSVQASSMDSAGQASPASSSCGLTISMHVMRFERQDGRRRRKRCRPSRVRSPPHLLRIGMQ